MSRFPTDFSLSRRSALQLFAAGSVGLTGCGGGSDAEPSPEAEPLGDSPDAAPTHHKRPDARLQRIADTAVSSGLVGIMLGEATVSGLSTAVAGKRRMGTQDMVQRSDLFPLGSNTKAWTAAAIVALAERGWLSLDITMAQAFPNWVGEMNPVYATVTLRDLLHHRAGLTPDMGSRAAYLGAVAADIGVLPDSLTARRNYFARWLLRQAPAPGVVPGSTFQYSSSGYALAAAVVEAITGRSFEVVFEAMLLRPLWLVGKWRSEVPGTDDQLWGHVGPQDALTVFEQNAELLALKPFLEGLYPAGHWSCSALHHAHWLRMHLLALKGFRTRLARTYVADLLNATDGQYVWGWRAAMTPSGMTLSHRGAVNGFMGYVVINATTLRAAFGYSNTLFFDDRGQSWTMSAIEAAVADIQSSPAGQNV